MKCLQQKRKNYLISNQKKSVKVGVKPTFLLRENMTLVYSTEIGRIKPEKEKTEQPKGDGIVRIQRQTSGRKGKGVCVITGLDLEDAALKLLAKELKKRTGVGGSIKDGTIEIQGDNRDLLKQLLEQKGFKVKFAGG